MHATTAPNEIATSNQQKLTQLSHLCVLLGALNETCKTQQGTRYSSGPINSDISLSKFQVFLNKLAQICDSKKGGTTMTALVCLKGPKGPDYVFCSNGRKDSDLDHTGAFLSDLLGFVSENAHSLNPKPLQKQVLWRILEFNSARVLVYLENLSDYAGRCLLDCERDETEDPEICHQLSLLREKANFPHDMTSDDARSRFLSNCEIVIKECVKARATAFATVLESRVKDANTGQSYNWCQLRHYLGRLFSYRQAADIIVAAPSRWPDLFQSFTVRHIPSAGRVRIPIAQTLTVEQLASVAFPDRQLSEFEADISPLEAFGLERNVRQQLQNRNKRTRVHGETQLHDYLVRQGKTLSSDYWNSTAFIATSKPPCRLCHFYFDSVDDNFVVSSPHMNLYPKWRLPDLTRDADQEAMERYGALLEDIIQDLQADTERILSKKLPVWRRNDSRTDTYAGSSAWGVEGGEETDSADESPEG